MIPALRTLQLKPQQKRLIVRCMAECLLTVILVLLAHNFPKLYKRSTKRGFFCDDESLKYPYHEDTVTADLLLFLALYVPSLLVIVGELISLLFLRKQNYGKSEDHGLVGFVLRLHHNIVPYYKLSLFMWPRQ